MRKHKFTLAALLIVSLGLCAGLAATPTSAAPDKEEKPADVDVKLHKECLYPVVKLLEIGKKSGASGFVVRSEKLRENVYYNLFLTCAHCVSEKDQEVVVFFYEDWSYVRKTVRFPCVFYGVNEDLDLAVGYFLSDQAVPTTTLCMDQKLYIGSEIFKIGCGIGQEPRLDYGKVTQPVRKPEVSEKHIRHSGTTVPGDSGSPVFYKHKVIGVTTHISATRGTPVFNIAFCLPIGRFHQWSRDNDGFYSHVFEKSAQMPKLPQYRLEVLNRYEIAK